MEKREKQNKRNIHTILMSVWLNCSSHSNERHFVGSFIHVFLHFDTFYRHTLWYLKTVFFFFFVSLFALNVLANSAYPKHRGESCGIHQAQRRDCFEALNVFVEIICLCIVYSSKYTELRFTMWMLYVA